MVRSASSVTSTRQWPVTTLPGTALVDVLASATDEDLAGHGLVKGTMALVDHARSEAIYATMGPTTEASGGSAANTAAGVASLGGRAAFLGRVADEPPDASV